MRGGCRAYKRSRDFHLGSQDDAIGFCSLECDVELESVGVEAVTLVRSGGFGPLSDRGVGGGDVFPSLLGLLQAEVEG